MPSQREAIASTITRERVSAIIRTEDQSLADKAMEAAVDGGFHMVEFTLTTPGAIALIRKFASRDGLLVGAGTVLSTGQANEAVAAGARFLVSPIVDPVVIAEAAALDVPVIPGAFSPTEMETAYRHGADFIKVFPAMPGGASFIEAIRGPLPHLRLFPTAGVTLDNFLDLLSAGCAGVGFVRSLFEPDDLHRKNFAAIRERARKIIQARDQWLASR